MKLVAVINFRDRNWFLTFSKMKNDITIQPQLSCRLAGEILNFLSHLTFDR